MRRVLYLLPLLLAALVLAGCSDEGAVETTPPPATSPIETAPPPTETAATGATEDGETSGMELKAEAGSSDNPDEYQIYLRDADGNDVTSLPPGQYTIKVEDHSDIHNFHLTGPGVDEMTPIQGTGEVEWQVTLAAGAYTFLCDPHPTEMSGQFTVG